MATPAAIRSIRPPAIRCGRRRPRAICPHTCGPAIPRRAGRRCFESPTRPTPARPTPRPRWPRPSPRTIGEEGRRSSRRTNHRSDPRCRAGRLPRRPMRWSRRFPRRRAGIQGPIHRPPRRWCSPRGTSPPPQSCFQDDGTARAGCASRWPPWTLHRPGQRTGTSRPWRRSRPRAQARPR